MCTCLLAWLDMLSRLATNLAGIHLIPATDMHICCALVNQPKHVESTFVVVASLHM